jgi:DNA-binding CsgD family transcriptional regulator
MRWLERRKQRQRQRKEAEAEDARLRGLTRSEIAEKVTGGVLAGRVAAGDTTKLADQIAHLTDRERYLLAMAAEGRTAREIAELLFEPLELVRRELRGIFEHLGWEGATRG